MKKNGNNHSTAKISTELYRNPIFRRISSVRQLEEHFSFTGLVMEWWMEARLFSVQIFFHNPPKELGVLSFRQLVFPRKQLPIETEVSDYMVVEVGGTQYLPLEALVVGMFKSGVANRPFMDVMRDYPHPEPSKTPPYEVPKMGFLVPELEDAGFEAFATSSMSERGEHLPQPVADIAWWPHYKGLPVRAAVAEFTLDPVFKAKWAIPAEVGLSRLFTEELARLYPDATKAFTEKGIANLRKDSANWKDWEEKRKTWGRK